jgi:hypothetical protein
MATIVAHLGGGWVSTDVDTHIEGISYEMALAMSRVGSGKMYSGILTAFESGIAEFGPVRGIDKKTSMFSNLITVNELPYAHI